MIDLVIQDKAQANSQTKLQTNAYVEISTAQIQPIEQIVQAQQVQHIAPHVVRLHNVQNDTATRQTVAQLAEHAAVDFAFVPADLSLKDFGLVVMDMDSTLITIECIDEIADMIGIKPQIAAITEATMRGEIADFKESLRRRVGLLKGLEASALERVYTERLQLSLGAEKMLQQLHAAGLKSLLVSGGFTYFTERLQQRLGLHFTRANLLEVVDGKLTGEVLGDIVDADAKRTTVESTCAQLGIQPQQTIVLGDGANDLKMMSIAGISVAFRAKPVVRAQTTYALNFAGLDGVLNWFKH